MQNIHSFKKNKGFTLIELLVVISIIGLLSSVVLASLQSARDKAQISSGILFSANNYHALSADAFGVWDFNDATASGWSSTNSVSASDVNYSLTPIIGTFTRSTITPVGTGYSLSLSNGGGWARKIISSNYPLATTKGITFSAWVYYTQAPDYSDIVSAINTNTYQWPALMVYDGSGLVCYSDLNSSPWVTKVQSLSQNRWYHFGCTISSSGLITYYINGKSVGTTQGSAIVSSIPITNIEVGGAEYDNGYITTSGLIDDVAMYSRALAESDIQSIYASGLSAHPNLAQK